MRKLERTTEVGGRVQSPLPPLGYATEHRSFTVQRDRAWHEDKLWLAVCGALVAS